jgi:hypothetical protein
MADSELPMHQVEVFAAIIVGKDMEPDLMTMRMPRRKQRSFCLHGGNCIKSRPLAKSNNHAPRRC